MAKGSIKTHRQKASLKRKKLASGVFLLLALLLMSPFLYVLHLGGIKQVVTDELNGLSPRINATVGAARFAFQFKATPISIIADDVVLLNGDDVLTVPNAVIGFGLRSLFEGRPNEVSLRGLRLDLVRGKDGWKASPTSNLIEELVEQNSPDISNAKEGVGVPPLAGIQSIVLQADQLQIIHKDLPDVSPFQMVDVSLRITADTEQGLGGVLSGAREVDGQDAGQFTAEFAGWPGAEGFLANLSSSNFQTKDLASYFNAVPEVISHLGEISGSFSAGFNAERLSRLDADLTARGGSFSMPGSGKEAGFDRAVIVLSYQRDANVLNIRQAMVDLKDRRQIGFVGDVVDFHSARPTFDGVLTANRLSLASLFDDWPSGVASGFKASLEERFAGGEFTDLTINLMGGYSQDTRRLAISQLEVLAGFDNVRMKLSAGQYKRIVGTIDGNVGLKLGLGGQVQKVSLGLNLKNGSAILADYPDAVPVNQLNIKANLEDSLLSVDEVVIALGDGGTFSGHGDLALGPDWSSKKLNLSLQTNRLKLDLYHAIWPTWVVPKTRQWVKEKVTKGYVQNANLIVASGFDDGVPSLTKLTGTLGLADARIELGGKLPIIENVSAMIALDEKQADIQLRSGKIDELALQQGRLTIKPIIGGKPTAKADINFKGGFGTVVSIAKSFGLAAVGAFDLGQIEAAGEVEMVVKTEFPIAQEFDKGDVDLSVDATVSGGRFSNMPFGAEVDRAELVLSVQPDIVTITGAADLFAVPTNFSFVSDLAKNTVEFIGKVAPSPAMAQQLATFSKLEIAGDVGANLTLRGDAEFDNLKVSLITDMRRASINVPVINWAKLPGENGVASLTFGVRGGRIYSLDNIDISLGSLSAVGQVVMGESNNVRGALFERVVWPGNDIRDLILETGSKGEWKIGATARLIDLVPLRRNKGVSEGKPISFDIVADNIVIGQDIVLQGHITGNKQTDGGGKATFSGNLLRSNNPMITEAEMVLSYGQKGDLLNGTGLIGGAETTIAYTKSKDNVPTLTMISKNAGRMLNGLGITDAISSGEIILTNKFVNDDLHDFDTDIKMTGFNVLEAPQALRMFSVLGPVGLYKLVEGEGTYFAWGEAKFEKRGPLIRLLNVRAGGDAVAVSLVGTYDTNRRQIDVSGNLVPANFVNKVAEAIPLLGKLLTGTDNSGILVSQFRMKGDIDDPETTANAASLVPGVLRDIFSPDWLGREGRRLLGTDNTTSQVPQP